MKLFYCVLALLLFANNSFAQSTLSNGLLACYDLNGNATDASGNNYNGIVHGSPTTGPDHLGNPNGAYLFNGTNDYVDITNAAFFLPTQWTYSAWVKVLSNPGTGSGSYIVLIGGSGGAQSLAINNQSNVSNQGFIATSYLVESTSDAFALSGTLPTLNTWYHVAGVRETDTVRIYVNGVQAQKTATTSSGIVYSNVANYATIGACSYLSNGFFNGYIDNVRIYSRPLTKSEVLELYTSTATCTSITTGILNTSTIQKFVVYPNPSSNGQCMITFPTSATGIYQVKVYDSKGIPLLSTNVDTANPLLDMSSLPKGIYMLSFLQNSNQASAKIVIE